MIQHKTASPVTLNYVAALRGCLPRAPGKAFRHLTLACSDTDYLICLAASNPEGLFVGQASSNFSKIAAETKAKHLGIGNVQFIDTPLQTLAADAKAGKSALQPFDYMVCDETLLQLTADDAAACHDCAQGLLLSGGIFNYAYRAYNDAAGHLRFLVNEFAPEMTPDQALTFLSEIKSLGSYFFSKMPEYLARLDAAINQKKPADFFALFSGQSSQSKTFDTIVAMRPRGFAYVGDTVIASNYVELSVPSQAQELVLSCQNNHLYEPIKDFTLNRQIRSDVWVKQPSQMSSDPAALFGGFAYGVTVDPMKVPTEIRTEGKAIDISAPVYKSLISLMGLIPATIGDFLSHPSGNSYNGVEVVQAMQILVACGIAKPMRGMADLKNVSNVEKPRLSGNFNKMLADVIVSTPQVRLASPVAGEPYTISVRDALVMQALDRAGLADSPAALMPELERVALNPAINGFVEAQQPTPESAKGMVEDVVSKSIVQWYAYGLLSAA